MNTRRRSRATRAGIARHPQVPDFRWDEHSTYIKKPPYFEKDGRSQQTSGRFARHARAGAIGRFSHPRTHFTGRIDSGEAGRPFTHRAKASAGDFIPTRAARNHEVMVRGTLANIRLRTSLLRTRRLRAPAGWRADVDLRRVSPLPEGRRSAHIIAGKEYGSGSSRGLGGESGAAAGVKVLAESFERIHRTISSAWACCRCSPARRNMQTLKLTGKEAFHAEGVAKGLLGGRVRWCARWMMRAPRSVLMFRSRRYRLRRILSQWRYSAVCPRQLARAAGERIESLVEYVRSRILLFIQLRRNSGSLGATGWLVVRARPRRLTGYFSR